MNSVFQRIVCYLPLLACITGSWSSLAQATQKKPLDHSVYDEWKRIENPVISNDGRYLSCEINPGRGDGALFLYDLNKPSSLILERGSQAVFSDNSAFLAWKIKSPDQLVRTAKRAGKAKDDLPEDSVGVMILKTGSVNKFARVKSFKVPEKGLPLLLIHHFPAADTTSQDTVRLKKNNGVKGGELKILEPLRDTCTAIQEVNAYVISRNGSLAGFTTQKADSALKVSVGIFDCNTHTQTILFEGNGRIDQLAVDDPGTQIAFLYNSDTARVTGYTMYYWSVIPGSVKKLADTLTEGLPAGWSISGNGKLWFSEDGSRLFFGTTCLPEPPCKDTLLDDEKISVDVWNWNDDLLQSQQKVRLKEDREKTYLACYDFRQKRLIQLADTLVESIQTIPKGNGDIALGIATRPYNKWISWKEGTYRDIYLVDMTTGKRTELLDAKNGPVFLSPAGQYVLWYETADSNWYTHEVSTERLTCLTCGIETAFYDESYDMPADPDPYGIAGWTENDEGVLIYDKYDIWKFDPSGRYIPLNLTNSNGRLTKIIFRYERLDTSLNYIPGNSPMLLNGINDSTKQTGFYAASVHLKVDPDRLVVGPYYFESPVKARDKNILIYRRGSFTEYPDIWTSDLSFDNSRKITNANPQAAAYLWGTPRLVHWTSFIGENLDGIIYVPENYRTDKKYPMLVYFYEKNSSDLYRHTIPSPSRSIINIPWCVSNGYIVFVPDIKYRSGYPGESAYDAVVSGTKAMVRQFSFIDEQHMAIQGQSLGGYQVAYLVTRTDIFRAAMAGAPVSNMTSAYGGIRWETGMSRMFQYEQSQSRIGGTLWDKTQLYLENSPLFHVPSVKTPLLIMHNDNDGAVPWYQGIELFVALRRLDKPAWMLVYNDEEHNLKKWSNRKDLSIRMMQFFDHYLKEAPMPAWMQKGVPALEKGQDFGYELID